MPEQLGNYLQYTTNNFCSSSLCKIVVPDDFSLVNSSYSAEEISFTFLEFTHAMMSQPEHMSSVQLHIYAYIYIHRDWVTPPRG